MHQWQANLQYHCQDNKRREASSRGPAVVKIKWLILERLINHEVIPARKTSLQLTSENLVHSSRHNTVKSKPNRVEIIPQEILVFALEFRKVFLSKIAERDGWWVQRDEEDTFPNGSQPELRFYNGTWQRNWPFAWEVDSSAYINKQSQQRHARSNSRFDLLNPKALHSCHWFWKQHSRVFCLLSTVVCLLAGTDWLSSSVIQRVSKNYFHA